MTIKIAVVVLVPDDFEARADKRELIEEALITNEFDWFGWEVSAPVQTPAASKLSRGLRNNNPGNIDRNSIKWKGMSPEQLDTRFITFLAPQWGIRAMARILLGDYREGQNTIASLINEWAPPVENDTTAYIAAVGRACSVDPYSPTDIPRLLPQLIAAIIKHENGVNPYTNDIIQLGIDLEASA